MSDEHQSGDESDEPLANAFGMTDQGRVRESNQDQFLIARLHKAMEVVATSLTMETRLDGIIQGQVLLVADGMGGHAAGEKASQIAITHLVRRLLNSVHWHFQGDDAKEKEFVEDLKTLIQDAHAQILRESDQHIEQRGMGTTLTMAYLVGSKLYAVHAGDSRCYLVRDGVAQQLTTDHTLARQMVEAGGMKPEEEASSKWSNVLWNVLGGRANGDLIAEVRRVDLENGDAVVLCSDGLHRYIGNELLAETISQAEHPTDACEQLIKLANNAGGEDNITVVVSFPPNAGGNSTWIDETVKILPSSSQEETEFDSLNETLPDVFG